MSSSSENEQMNESGEEEIEEEEMELDNDGTSYNASAHYRTEHEETKVH